MKLHRFQTAIKDMSENGKQNLLLAVLSFIFLMALLTWIHNRYLPIQEGWIHYYSLLTGKGLFPYRDFYYFTQPIPLFIQQIISRFGDAMIYDRYFGLLERATLSFVVYFLLSRDFSPQASFLGTLTAMFLFQCYSSDTLYTYHQTTLLFYLVALVCLYFAERSNHPEPFLFIIGILSSLAFFTKQSNGLFVILVLLFLVLWQAPKVTIFSRLVIFGSGLTLPFLLILGWIMRNNALEQYLSQVFAGGISAKGSFLSVLFGFIARNDLGTIFLLGSLILVLIYYLKIVKVLDISLSQASETYPQGLTLFLPACIALSMGLAFLMPLNKSSILFTIISREYLELWKYLTFYLVSLSSLMIGARWLTRRQLPFSRFLAELWIASFVWIYASSLAFEIDVASMLPATGLVIAYLFDRVRTNVKIFYPLIVAAVCLVIFTSTLQKLQTPYYWWGWFEYGHTESVTTSIPAFRGFQLSKENAAIYEKLYLDIISNTKPDEKIYTYPHIVSLNYITGRLQPTFAPVDYYDVTPDDVAIRDADILRNNPPKMIIVLVFPEDAKEFHETHFRSGNKSGQREIEKTIKELIDTYGYNVIDTFSTPGNHWNLIVYLKSGK